MIKDRQTKESERPGDTGIEGLQHHPEVDALAGVLIAYLLNPQLKCASTLSGDEVREWAWGSVKGAVLTNYVPYLM